MGGLRELHSHGSLNHFYGYFFQVSFGQSFFLFKYLFIYLPCVGSQFQHAGSLLWWDPKCVGSVVAACGLSSYSAWAQCPIAFGVLIPRSGIEPMSPTLEGGFLTTSPPGKSLPNHIDLPGSETIFGMSQCPPICSHASLSQDRFYRRGLWEICITQHHSLFDFQEVFLCLCGWGGLLTSIMRNIWSLVFYLDKAQPPPSVVLLFLSWSISSGGRGDLPPASQLFYLINIQ